MESKLHSRTPWHEKMNKPAEPRIVHIKSEWGQWQRQFGNGTMLIATPRHIQQLMEKARKGKLLTIGQIRERLAKDFGTTTTCPLTTGIFARIVAEAANEELESGKLRVTPFWRLIRDDGTLMEKFPGGASEQAKMLRKEGHTIIASKTKKPPRVKDHERKLVKL
jgi:alkylated DNA nucleotide flippase Atl1